MFWYATVHVLLKLGFFRLYVKFCDMLINLVAEEDEG